MLDNKDLLQKLVELYEKQEGIKITYQIIKKEG